VAEDASYCGAWRFPEREQAPAGDGGFSVSTTGSEQWKLFKNGAEWDSATITSVFTGVNSGIGSLNGTGSLLPFDGTVSELISFPGVLSTADRQLLERNIGAYYGITVA
jgi:hypothetical protein